mmetsp:Transcript_18042/g.58905  ORF Transcript_18042/g.58905 Transcript_18042/m.58905 type:complete len:101 (-) Transcript_18042:349-651(-)
MAPPHLSEVRHRIDVTLSTSAVNRVLRPSILMRVTLSDGAVHTFEVTTEQFNELRRSVALALHQMDTIEPKAMAAFEVGAKARAGWKAAAASAAGAPTGA